jgi:type I restriction enzyme S subunit
LGGEHPLIQTGDVANSGGYIRHHSSTYSEAGLQQSKKWPVGTLCITIAANIAQTGILTFPACFPDSVVGFSHDHRGMIQYVRVWLGFLRSTLERTAPTVAQKNINLEILRGLPIALPPAALTEEFAVRLDAQLAVHEAQWGEQLMFDTLFSSLQHRAFSGQL